MKELGATAASPLVLHKHCERPLAAFNKHSSPILSIQLYHWYTHTQQLLLKKPVCNIWPELELWPTHKTSLWKKSYFFQLPNITWQSVRQLLRSPGTTFFAVSWLVLATLATWQRFVGPPLWSGLEYHYITTFWSADSSSSATNRSKMSLIYWNISIFIGLRNTTFGHPLNES